MVCCLVSGLDNEEFQQIQASLAQQSRGLKELLSPRLRPALLIGVGLAIFRNMSGLNTAIFYAPTIFQFAGFSSAAVDILATVGIGLILVFAIAIAMHLVDRVRRQPLLSIGFIGMGLGLGLLGPAFHLPELVDVLGPIALASLMVFVASWAPGPGTVYFVPFSVPYPLKIRGLAMSLTIALLWGAYLIATLTFLTMTRILRHSVTYWCYSLVGIGAWFFSYFLVPETRGQTLEEIEAHRHAGKSPRELTRRPPGIR